MLLKDAPWGRKLICVNQHAYVEYVVKSQEQPHKGLIKVFQHWKNDFPPTSCRMRGDKEVVLFTDFSQLTVSQVVNGAKFKFEWCGPNVEYSILPTLISRKQKREGKTIVINHYKNGADWEVYVPNDTPVTIISTPKENEKEKVSMLLKNAPYGVKLKVADMINHLDFFIRKNTSDPINEFFSLAECDMYFKDGRCLDSLIPSNIEVFLIKDGEYRPHLEQASERRQRFPAGLKVFKTNDPEFKIPPKTNGVHISFKEMWGHILINDCRMPKDTVALWFTPDGEKYHALNQSSYEALMEMNKGRIEHIDRTGLPEEEMKKLLDFIGATGTMNKSQMHRVHTCLHSNYWLKFHEKL